MRPYGPARPRAIARYKQQGLAALTTILCLPRSGTGGQAWAMAPSSHWPQGSSSVSTLLNVDRLLDLALISKVCPVLLQQQLAESVLTFQSRPWRTEFAIDTGGAVEWTPALYYVGRWTFAFGCWDKIYDIAHPGSDDEKHISCFVIFHAPFSSGMVHTLFTHTSICNVSTSGLACFLKTSSLLYNYRPIYDLDQSCQITTLNKCRLRQRWE